MDNKPILKIDKNGHKRWRLHGKFHRVDGPAIEYADGFKSWWLNGRHHRVDGPAIEYAGGNSSWYLNGRRYSFDEWIDINTYISEEEKVMLKLQYG
jgi:hypothetical protein